MTTYDLLALPQTAAVDANEGNIDIFADDFAGNFVLPHFGLPHLTNNAEPITTSIVEVDTTSTNGPSNDDEPPPLASLNEDPGYPCGHRNRITPWTNNSCPFDGIIASGLLSVSILYGHRHEQADNVSATIRRNR